nr:gluconate 2-dehydrogenase subunit 3 family protein [Acidobacteriota bacterium]
QEWRAGLKLIDQLSAGMHGKPFMQSSSNERIALLTRIASGEADPQKPEEKFFVELKSRIAHAYYTSKIGIHQELEYKGNTYLREFAGVDVSKK